VAAARDSAKVGALGTALPYRRFKVPMRAHSRKAGFQEHLTESVGEILACRQIEDEVNVQSQLFSLSLDRHKFSAAETSTFFHSA
jgi:hypothetical protein